MSQCDLHVRLEVKSYSQALFKFVFITMHGEMKIAHNVLVVNREGKRLLWSRKLRFEDEGEVDLK